MSWKVVSVGLLIAGLALYLRMQQFYAFPVPADTYDEYKSAFNGISLLREGIPKSWSWLDQYQNSYLTTIGGSTVRIVWPWFDEPPLSGLIIGEYALARGMDNFELVNLATLRHPFVYLGAISTLLLFIVIWQVSGISEAIFGSLLYATIPTVVLSSRLPLSENLVVPASLFCLLLLVTYLKSKKIVILLLLSVISASTFLIKVPAIFVSVSLIGLFLIHNQVREALIVLACLLIAIGVWLGFGLYYDFDLFLQVTSEHNARSLFSPLNIVNLFEVFRISERSMEVDGWMIWGWIAVVLFCFRSSEKRLLARSLLPLTIGSYLIIFMIMNGQIKGWYRFPFYPFLCWAMSAVFIETLKNPRLLTSFFFITIALASSYFYGSGQWMWKNAEAKIFQPIFLLIISPYLAYEIWPKMNCKRVAQVTLVLAMILALFYNIRTILLFQDQFWY